MSKDVYGQSSILVSEIIGREYNNPLGPAVLETLVARTPLASGSRVLDVGSGRGLMAVALWNLCGASVTGLEISEAMWRKAVELARRKAAPVAFLNQDVAQAHLEAGSFDAVMSFDVLAYVKARAPLLADLHRALRQGGTLLYTDYHLESRSSLPDATRRLVEAWQIVPPQPLGWHRELLEVTGFQVVEARDTTAQYRAHWQEMRQRTLERKERIVTLCGEEAFATYLASTEAILEGVDRDGFGHCLVMATKK